MVYKWKDASRIKADAQTAGEICERLEKSGGLTARRLVDESRPEDAPLHNEFEWDDATAAEAYRETQARYIIRSLVVACEEEKNEPVRAFFKTPETNAYENITVIFSDTEKTSSLLDMALKELKSFKSKYSGIVSFKNLFEEIDNLLNENHN